MNTPLPWQSPKPPTARELATARRERRRAGMERLRTWYKIHEGDLYLLAVGAGLGLMFGLSVPQ